MDIEFTFPEKEVLKKIARFCSYRDRASEEVKQKLVQYHIAPGRADKFLDRLKEEGFVDDRRFAESYVRSKVNQNHWGRNKIRAGLKAKKIDENIINTSMQTIDDEQYIFNLRHELDKKTAALKTNDRHNEKLIRFALSKGYLYHEIQEILKETK